MHIITPQANSQLLTDSMATQDDSVGSKPGNNKTASDSAPNQSPMPEKETSQPAAQDPVGAPFNAKEAKDLVQDGRS